MGTRKIAGPGRIGSKERMKKTLKGGGNPNIRTIPGEDALTVRFLTSTDDWHGYYEHWLSDGPVPCTTDDCEGCASDDEEERRKSFRYLANAYVVDDQKVRAVKLPKSLAEQLVAYQTKYKTLMDRDYDLTKTGSGMTGTKYMAAPDAPSKMKLSRFDDKLLDLGDVLQSMLDDEDDDDVDEAPKSKPKKSKKSPWEDDDDDFESETERTIKKIDRELKKEKKKAPAKKSASSVAKKRPVKKTVAKRKVRR